MPDDAAAWRSFVDSCGDGLVVTDPQGHIVEFNRALENMTGYSKAELMGKKIWEAMAVLVPEEDRTRAYLRGLEDAVDEALRTGSLPPVHQTGTTKLRRKDGKRIWAEGSRMVISSPEGNRFLSIIRDVTERKEMEQRSKSLYEKHRTIFETTGAGALIIEEDGRISTVNASFSKLVGMPKEEIEWRKSWHEFVHPSDMERMQGYARLRRADPKSAPSEYEFKLLDRDGKVHSAMLYVSTIPGTSQIVASVMDITEIREAYETLMRLQVRTRDILDSIGDAFFSLDEQSHITYFNDAAERIFRRKRREVLGVALAKALPEMKGSIFERRFREAMEERRPQVFEAEYSQGQDTDWFDVRAYPQDRGVSIFIQVATGRKLMEQQLELRTEELDKFFTSSLDLLAIADGDGYFRRLNPEWERALGYKLDEMLDHRFMDFVHPEDVASTMEVVRVLAEQRTVFGFTNRYRAKDGSYRWIEWRSMPSGSMIYAAARDITFRVEAEAALKESERKYRELVENAQEGIWATDGEWRTTFVNQRMASMLGYSVEEMLGRSVVDFLDEEARQALDFMDSERAKALREQYDMQIPRKDGTRIYVNLHISPLSQEEGVFSGVLALASDITERKMMELALKEANSKLNLLNSLTRHDLSNQLVVMRGHLVLAEKGTQNEGVRKHLRKALKAGDNIHRLLEFSRDYQGLGKDKPQWMNLQEVCTLGLTSVDLGHVAVETDLGDFEVFADKMMEKVFHNLASNSINHGERTSRICVSCREEGRTLRIVYTDDGVGIPQERKAEILGPNQGYHGLNLAKGVLEMTGMAIRENGAPGEGARFEIIVPSQSYRKP